MRRSKIFKWIVEQLGDLAVGVTRGDRTAILILGGLVAAMFILLMLVHPRGRKVVPASEDRWEVPSAEEVARVVGPPEDASSGDRDKNV